MTDKNQMNSRSAVAALNRLAGSRFCAFFSMDSLISGSDKMASLASKPLRTPAVLLASLLLANAGFAATKLATEPFSQSTTLYPLPNIMFVLDDSGSMGWDYLPDWAGPYKEINEHGVEVEKVPAPRFFNAAFNGVAYNPGTRYDPPVMYTSTGARDYTTYPSMDGTSEATGGDATATATEAGRNWKAVKVDGFGIQSTAKVNLEGAAFSYVTVPGEYCTNEKLRTCIASDVPTGTHKHPASLRWCTTQANAEAATAVAGTACQASNIADTPTNAANGVTTYTFPRMPVPPLSTMTIAAGGGTITKLTFTSAPAPAQIITSGAATGSTSSDLATALAAKINACTYDEVGDCQAVGFRAVAAADKVYIYSPVNLAASAKPEATPAALASATVFSKGSVPGSTLFTAITRAHNVYNYPGSAQKSSNRTDCAGTSCTYAEEMTNYANWYAYSRTRMQMMKSASGLAFSKLGDSFRVGYYSLNNGAGNQFLNVGAFDAAQRYAWYQKFMGAKPDGPTPLRTGLSNIGRFYAGKLNSATLNDVTVFEPMQYSCQKNFTILSTDGYWNDTETPKQLDGATEIGQQDGHLDRPFYDGGTQTKKTTQHLKTETQHGLSSWKWESWTQQQQKQVQKIEETKTTEVTWPWKVTNSQLQRAETLLKREFQPLERKSYPLTSTTKKLTKTEQFLIRTPYTPVTTDHLVKKSVKNLHMDVYDIDESHWRLVQKVSNPSRSEVPLERWEYRIKSDITPLVQKTYQLDAVEKVLNQVTYDLTWKTTKLQQREFKVKESAIPLYSQKYFIHQSIAPLRENKYKFTEVKTPLLEKIYKLVAKETVLQRKTFYVLQTNWKLQKNAFVKDPSNETWGWTGFMDAASCDTTHASSVAYPGNKDKCQYVKVSESTLPDGTACTPVNASSGPAYTVKNPVTCAYQEPTTPGLVENVTVVGEQCIPKAQSGTFANAQVTCTYTGAVTTNGDASSCTAHVSTSSPYTGPKRECSFGVLKATNSVSRCVENLTDKSMPKVECAFEAGGGFTIQTAYNKDECRESGGTGSGTVASPYIGQKVRCTPTLVAGSGDVVSSCTPENTESDGKTQLDLTKKYTACVYDAYAPSTNVRSCSPQDQNPVSRAYKTAYKCENSNDKDTAPSARNPESVSCTPRKDPLAKVQEVRCEYGPAGAATLKDTCVPKAKSPEGSETYYPATQCVHQTGTGALPEDYVAPAVDAGSCEVDSGLNNSGQAVRIKRECGYTGTSATTANNKTTCAPNDQGTLVSGQTYTGDKLECGYETNHRAGSETPIVGTCTINKPANPTVPGTGCVYAAASPAATVDSCTVQNEAPTSGTAGAHGAQYTGPARSCAYQSTFTTVTYNNKNNRGTCKKHDEDTGSTNGTIKKSKVTCTYDTANTTPQSNLTSCSPQGETPVGLDYTGPAETCAYESLPAAGQTPLPKDGAGVQRCTRVPQDPQAKVPWFDCVYNEAHATTPTPANCVPSSGTQAGNDFTGPKVNCTYETGEVESSPASCKPGTDPTTGVVTTCNYVEITGERRPHVDSCTNVNSRTVADGSGYFHSPVTECTRNAVKDGSRSDEFTEIHPGSCTLVPETTPPATGLKVDCRYDDPASESTLAVGVSCTKSNWNPTAGTFPGAQINCEYVGTSQPSPQPATCTYGEASTGNTLTSYSTCGYQAGTPDPAATRQTSCTVVPKATSTINGTVYSAAWLCDHAADNSATHTVKSNVDSWTTPTPVGSVTSCTPQGSAGDYTKTIVSCAYETTGTPDSGLTNCTTHDESAQGAGMQGPAVSCVYSGTHSAAVTGSTNNKETNLDAARCEANDEGAGPFTRGPKITCAWGAAQTDRHKDTCAANEGADFLHGAKAVCSYETAGTPVDTNLPCTNVAPATISGTGQATYSKAVNCSYRDEPEAYAEGTCVNKSKSTGPGFSEIHPKLCVAGPFAEPATTVTTPSPVSSCSTVPIISGDLTRNEKQTKVTTSCAYLAVGPWEDAASCSVGGGIETVAGGNSYTERVNCQLTNPTEVWVATESCTATGGFLDASGKIVNCKKTEAVTAGTGPEAAPVPADCTVSSSVDPHTKVHTACKQTIKNGPTAVEPGTCTSASAGAGNSYMSTSCDVDIQTYNDVTGCLPTPATAGNLWTKVECTGNPGSGTSNSLADVAAYYYYTDLRDTSLGNCAGAPMGSPAVSNDLCAKNDVKGSATDPLTTQHMTTFTLGLGASGYMRYSKSYLADANLTPPVGDYATVWGTGSHSAAEGTPADPDNGVCSWQQTGHCNWPYPQENEQTTIDDLWHAGVNGHGAYFSATDPTTLSTSISGALDSVMASAGSASAPAVSSPSLSSGDNYIFASSYTSSDWTGDLQRRQIDPNTGILSANEDWSVAAKLDAKDLTTRKIHTFKAGGTNNLQDFNSTNFGTNGKFRRAHIDELTQYACALGQEDLCLSEADKNVAQGADLVNFLRGDRSNEGLPTDKTKPFRKRVSLLGDLVNAQVVFMRKPRFNYVDAGYEAFVTANQSRKAVVFAAANDGMLHTFAAEGSAATEALVKAAAIASNDYYLTPDSPAAEKNAAKLVMETKVAAAKAAIGSDTEIGQELWAYVPSMVLPNLYKLADKKYSVKHHYFVDGSPVVADICASACGTVGAVWKTILVGGLGRGGTGYYALDVTDPASPKALWEFENANMGYSFGAPQIVKRSDGKWVVLLTSGYNNIPNALEGTTGDGVGRLFVLDANSGDLLDTLVTENTTGNVGSVANPSGLTHIIAQVVNPLTDSTVEAVYGGDLLGNLWRFDINGNIGAAGKDAQLLAVLKDASGNVQPITSAPEVAMIPETRVKAVFVGTGRLLHTDDASSVGQQSFYAIKDERAETNAKAPTYDNPRSLSSFVKQVQSERTCDAAAASLNLCKFGETAIGSTNNLVDWATGDGWMLDFVFSGERLNTSPSLSYGMVVFNTNVPSTNACDLGGKSYRYYLNYKTGGPVQAVGNVVPGTSLGYVGSALANSLSSGGSIISVSGGSTPFFLSGTGAGPQVDALPNSPESSVTRRVSWRELIRE